MSIMHCSLLSLGCAFGFSPYADQRVLSGLRALKIAQRRLRPEVRSKLIGATSARAGADLMPEAWRFVFLDPATSGNCRIVTVAAKASSEHPDTVEAFSSMPTESPTDGHVITQNKLQIDSEQALATTRSTSKLKGVRAAEYKLVQARTGQEPVWILSFFGDGSESLAQFQVGAKNGTVKILQKAA